MLIFENLNFNHPPPLPRIQKIKLIIPLSSEVDLKKKTHPASETTGNPCQDDK